MINDTNLRMARHYGAFGDFPCGCKLCRNNRLKLENRTKLIVRTIALLVVILIVSCRVAHADTLQASYYSEESLKHEGTWAKSHGIMANGRVFDEKALTCATRLYPLGSHLLVTNLKTGKSVLVVVTDRIGKRFAKTRIDLSRGSFLRIGSLKAGLIPVKVSLVNIKVKKGAYGKSLEHLLS